MSQDYIYEWLFNFIIFFGSIEREKNPNPSCKVENYDIIDREFNLDVDWVEYCVEWEK